MKLLRLSVFTVFTFGTVALQTKLSRAQDEAASQPVASDLAVALQTAPIEPVAEEPQAASGEAASSPGAAPAPAQQQPPTSSSNFTGTPQDGDEGSRVTEPPKQAARFKAFEIKAEDGNYALKIGGLVQADGRFPLDSGGDTFVVRRARLDLTATLAKYFSLRLHPELADSKLTLLDAYLGVALVEEVQLQVGKMKAPIGLELLQSPRDIPFAELGLPSLLVPNRDVGVLFQGKLFAGTVEYQAGVFNGVADGAKNTEQDENDAKQYEGRVVISPFASTEIAWLAGLGLSIAGSTGEQAGALPSYKTAGQQTFFNYAATAVADGNHTHLSPQGYYYYGPFGLLGEYVRSSQRVTDATSAEVTSSAWQVTGSFVLGGEASYKGARVDAPLDPGAGTWGAVEIAARYGALNVDREAFVAGLADPTTSARGAHHVGLAVGWWFLKGTRALLSFDHTAFDGGAPAGDRESDNVVVARLQAAL